MSGPSKNPAPRTVMLDLPPGLHDKYRARLAERSRLDPASGCIVWTRYTVNGYGRVQLWIDGRTKITLAHRLAWILEKGPISDPELVLDHLCRNRGCINPAHLELVTAEENSRRGDSWRQHTRHKGDFPDTARDACRHGHPWPRYAVERISRGRRIVFCIECRRVQYRAWYAKQRTALPK